MASNETESLPSVRDAPAPATLTQHTHKSFKRKFAKLKIKFEHAMKESNALIKEELRIIDLAKRLKEQNDQMLDLLLELNNSIRIPPHHRYKLSLPDDSLRGIGAPEEGPTVHCDPGTARERLREAKERLQAGTMTAEDCRQLEESMLRGEQFAPSAEFAALLKVPHTEHTSTEDDLDSTLGFLTPAHETEYVVGMDTGSGGIARASDRRSSIDREREAAFRNPLSVYNWLKKNQPHVFQHDGDSVSDKPATRSTGTRASKRERAPPPVQEDIYDEDGILIDIPPPSGGRGKRKRDEDGGYRPKGGSGGRKKKKGDDTSKRAKRASAAGSAA
ncbi:hypothetical protein VTO42DRAFT_7041 [Malbranchea cinnamomea]